MAKVAEAEVKVKATGQAKFKADMKKAQAEVKKFGSSISSMSLAAKAGWGIAAFAVTGFLKTITQASIAFEQRFSSFSRLVSGDAERFLDTLNAAADGTISNLQLVTQANNAILLGIKQEQLPELLEASRVLGAAVGRTTAQAFSDLTIGIGRQSRLILDNLGIIFKAEEAYKAYADSIGKSVNALTAQERQTAAQVGIMKSIEESVGKLEGSVTEATTQTEKFTKQWEDFIIRAGDPVKGSLTGWLKLFNDIIDVMEGVSETAEETMPQAFQDIMALQERFKIERETTAGFESALANAEEVAGLEKEIAELIKEKDLTQLENIRELHALQELLNNRQREGLEIMGKGFKDVVDAFVDELVDDVIEPLRGSRGRTREQAMADVLAGGGIVVE